MTGYRILPLAGLVSPGARVVRSSVSLSEVLGGVVRTADKRADAETVDAIVVAAHQLDDDAGGHLLLANPSVAGKQDGRVIIEDDDVLGVEPGDGAEVVQIARTCCVGVFAVDEGEIATQVRIGGHERRQRARRVFDVQVEPSGKHPGEDDRHVRSARFHADVEGADE